MIDDSAYPYRGPESMTRADRIRRNMQKLMNAQLLDVVDSKDYTTTLLAWNQLYCAELEKPK